MHRMVRNVDTHTAVIDDIKDVDVINKLKIDKSNLGREALVPEESIETEEGIGKVRLARFAVPKSGLEKDIRLLIPCCLLRRKPMFGDVCRDKYYWQMENKKKVDNVAHTAWKNSPA
jgi:hypothetical protein|mmetsp:Transcript_4628/g.8217  ORF Transcript_4628/g.8217 Transcript_4628/m.8217 type:complete len:117 (-) Transcript_4628:647-997(-)